MEQKKITVIEPVKQRLQGYGDVPSNKLRVAAYARVSTEQDEQQSSYEAQVNYYTHYIQSNPDWEFVGIFADEGITGTNTKKREGFNLMVEKALNGEIDLILTKSISRFARNTVDTLQVVRKLKAKSVEVRFEKENLHTLDPKCEVMLSILASLAQEESRSISENVRWGKQRSMQKGNISLAYSRFLGYKKGKDGRPEIVPEEAEIVRKIYQMFLDGKSIRAIAQHLTDTSVLTPAGKQNWRVSTIKSILTNEKYKGDALLQKTYTVDYLTKEVRKNNGEAKQYWVENSHEGIVDHETFEAVQEEMEKRSKKPRTSSTSPFSGKLICSECGGFYGHKVWHNYNNTERYDMWYCNHKYQDPKCSSPILKQTQIEEAFTELLTKLGKGQGYSEELWRELVDHVVVNGNPDRLEFTLRDKRIVEIRFH